jgi:hypothetical protein
MKSLFGLICLLGIASNLAHAETHESNFRKVVGVKLPNFIDEGSEPAITDAFSPIPGTKLGGFSELVPYALPAPDQDEAGSCLYMSLTGVAEWWMARLHPELPRTSDGPLDFSERYLMNLSGSEDAPELESWLTDSIYFFNHHGYTVKNSDYRFTKGWWKKSRDGSYVPARPGAHGANYGVEYNWIDSSKAVAATARVPLPRFRREVLFADPEENQWNVGVAPANLVDQIKEALVRNKAPVHIIYNHMGYWHANYIVGFDDNADNQNCHYMNEFFKYLQKKEASLQLASNVEIEGIDGGNELMRVSKTYKRLRKMWDENGGCHPKGVFYVRDSIYSDPRMPSYVYDPSNPASAAPYSQTIVLLEYDWIRYTANHAVQILVD